MEDFNSLVNNLVLFNNSSNVETLFDSDLSTETLKLKLKDIGAKMVFHDSGCWMYGNVKILFGASRETKYGTKDLYVEFLS